jgi:hypothetical protein
MLKKLTILRVGWFMQGKLFYSIHIGNSHYEAHELDMSVKYCCIDLYSSTNKMILFGILSLDTSLSLAL